MGSVNLQLFYPNNSPTNATVMNNNGNAINGSTSGLNQQNVRTEAIDYRNLNQSLTTLKVAKLQNGYFPAFGGSASAGATYNSFALDTSTRERPINHDNTGATTTATNQGTKLALGSGVALKGGELVKTAWNVQVWANGPHTPLSDLICNLISGITNGSGIGEWCWAVYPKFNVTSSALNNNDFVDALTAGLVSGTPFMDPTTITPPLTIGSTFYGFNAYRWDHAMMIPSMFASATDNPNAPVIMVNCGNAGPDNDTYLGGPQMFHSDFIFKVKPDVNITLYGIQLYISGYWRMHSTSAPGTAPPYVPGAFLEYQVSNPAGPAPNYWGVEGAIQIGTVETTCVIHSDKVS